MINDKKRLDFLEKMLVEVRIPARYGSFAGFISSPTENDGGEDDPSDIRFQIDKLITENKSK